MRLSDYLAVSQTTIEDFARRIGVHKTVTVRRYLSGARIPARAVMTRIVEETKGAVQPNDFYSAAAE